MKLNATFVPVMALIAGVIQLSCKEPTSEIQHGLGIESTYASIHKNILQPKCLRCHTGPDSPHGIDLSNYESIVKSTVFPPLVVPGAPDDSSLFDSVNAGRMPKRAPILEAEEIGAIREWIEKGAKENPNDPDPAPEPCEQENPEDCES